MYHMAILSFYIISGVVATVRTPITDTFYKMVISLEDRTPAASVSENCKNLCEDEVEISLFLIAEEEKVSNLLSEVDELSEATL